MVSKVGGWLVRWGVVSKVGGVVSKVGGWLVRWGGS